MHLFDSQCAAEDEDDDDDDYRHIFVFSFSIIHFLNQYGSPDYHWPCATYFPAWFYRVCAGYAVTDWKIVYCRAKHPKKYSTAVIWFQLVS